MYFRPFTKCFALSLTLGHGIWSCFCARQLLALSRDWPSDCLCGKLGARTAVLSNVSPSACGCPLTGLLLPACKTGIELGCLLGWFETKQWKTWWINKNSCIDASPSQHYLFWSKLGLGLIQPGVNTNPLLASSFSTQCLMLKRRYWGMSGEPFNKHQPPGGGRVKVILASRKKWFQNTPLWLGTHMHDKSCGKYFV